MWIILNKQRWYKGKYFSPSEVSNSEDLGPRHITWYTPAYLTINDTHLEACFWIKRRIKRVFANNAKHRSLAHPMSSTHDLSEYSISKQTP